MDRNSVPPKTKPPPPESSEEESGSSDEETEDEEQAEGGSGFESGSDESTDTTKKKLISILPTKQQSVVKVAAGPGSPAKRTREANGKKEKEDEPPSKKKKPEVATPALRAVPKPTAQQSDKRSTTKAEKGKSTPAAIEKPSKDLTAEKDTKKSSKKKAQSPAAAKPTTSKSEDETPQKPKTSSRPWSPDEELALSRELQKDRVNEVYGSTLPSSRSDPYWEKLMGRFSFMDKYEKEQRIERLCEKVRRMRLRYENLQNRIKAGETSVYKNPHEAVLWRIWHTIWGPNKATPGMLTGDDEEDEDEEEDEDSDDDGSDEDEEEEIVPTQGKGRPLPVGRVTAQKKAVSRKVVESGSDDDEEDSPVKATPPAVLAAVPTPAATSGAGKQVSTAKSVPAKGPTPTAMDVDLNTSGKNASQRVAVHNGAQGVHLVIPALTEKSVRVDALPRVSDEMRAENLALLRDMRGTCVKMVEEAKAQSLMITEKILEETRVKTTQIVEEARVKSAQIMEELRLVVERLGTITGQNGRMNGSHVGRWNDLSDNPFQGTGLLGSGALLLGDPNNLDGKWREQSEAEQGLLLQRLQLVQEQARIQQEGIRLKLNLQKQQALAQDKV